MFLRTVEARRVVFQAYCSRAVLQFGGCRSADPERGALRFPRDRRDIATRSSWSCSCAYKAWLDAGDCLPQAIRTTARAFDAPLGEWTNGTWRGVPSSEAMAVAAAEMRLRLRLDREKLNSLTRAIAALAEDQDSRRDDACDAIIVPNTLARRIKVGLGTYFRNEFSIAAVNENEVAVPVTHDGMQALLAGSVTFDMPQDVTLRSEKLALPRRKAVEHDSFGSRLESAVTSWARLHATSSRKSWSKLGNNATLVPTDFCPSLDDQVDLWAVVAAATRSARVIAQIRPAPNSARAAISRCRGRRRRRAFLRPYSAPSSRR